MISRYVQSYKGYSKVVFIVRLAFELVCIAVFLSVALPYVPGMKSSFDASQITVFYALLSIIFAPLVETWFFQDLILRAAKKLITPRKVRIVLSIVIFAGAHFIWSIPQGIGTIFVGSGLAFAYLFWLREGRNQAFYMTMATHALYNASLIGLSLLGL